MELGSRDLGLVLQGLRFRRVLGFAGKGVPHQLMVRLEDLPCRAKAKKKYVSSCLAEFLCQWRWRGRRFQWFHEEGGAPPQIYTCDFFFFFISVCIYIYIHTHKRTQPCQIHRPPENTVSTAENKQFQMIGFWARPSVRIRL